MDRLINQIISVLVGCSVFTFSGMLFGIIKATLTIAMAPSVVALVILIINYIIQKVKKKGSEK